MGKQTIELYSVDEALKISMVGQNLNELTRPRNQDNLLDFIPECFFGKKHIYSRKIESRKDEPIYYEVDGFIINEKFVKNHYE